MRKTTRLLRPCVNGSRKVKTCSVNGYNTTSYKTFGTLSKDFKPKIQFITESLTQKYNGYKTISSVSHKLSSKTANIHTKFQKYYQKLTKIHTFYLSTTLLAANSALSSANNAYFKNYSLLSPGQSILKKTKSSTEIDPPSSNSFLYNLYLSFYSFFHSTCSFIMTLGRVCELLLKFSPVIVSFPVCIFVFPSSLSQSWYRLFGYTLSICGPCFIKLGQWISTRYDLFPAQLCATLSSLRTRAPFHRFYQTRKIIESAFNDKIANLFLTFNPIPLASGAIAQVYKATVLIDSIPTEVAVKVRHPKVERQIRRDLRILRALVSTIEFFYPMPWLRLTGNVNNFARGMEAQTDFRVEAGNLVRFQKSFEDIPGVRFPTPVSQLIHKTVFVQTFEEGQTIDKIADNPTISSAQKKHLASIGLHTYLKMILEDSFAHADLHPGNILVTKSKGSKTDYDEVVFLDAGLVVELEKKDKDNFMNLFEAVLQGNGEKAATLIMEGQNHLKESERREFSKGLAETIEEIKDKDMDKVKVTEVFFKVLHLARVNHVMIDSAFTTLVIGTIIVEGIGKRLDPEMNFVDSLKPFVMGDRKLMALALKKKLSEKFRHFTQ
eukprot:TRINITY_DN2790_c0_g1_i1.p1 TRINITY_DN2790_c0_g1~~TRINITY_DN2790_c0_g1_i1.p1  ORF type:complete len:607 (-),score=110.01 TRINITY_DN2790_c0_g1_i1:86-1906(-)